MASLQLDTDMGGNCILKTGKDISRRHFHPLDKQPEPPKERGFWWPWLFSPVISAAGGGGQCNTAERSLRDAAAWTSWPGRRKAAGGERTAGAPPSPRPSTAPSTGVSGRLVRGRGTAKRKVDPAPRAVFSLTTSRVPPAGAFWRGAAARARKSRMPCEWRE